MLVYIGHYIHSDFGNPQFQETNIVEYSKEGVGV
jgi:hypothetical protein